MLSKPQTQQTVWNTDWTFEPKSCCLYNQQTNSNKTVNNKRRTGRLHNILHHIWKFNASSATAASAVAAMRPLATSTAASFYPVHHQAIMTETCRKCDLAKTTMSTTKRLKTTKKQIEATIQSRSTAGRSCSIPASAITAGSVVIATENSDDVYSCTTCINGATENARPENAGLENDGPC